ncbi:hypothetical protein JXM83_02090 [Candidatus Woesearchaeota archaeon]|nr:hypothetical protein [Candidatus Woesearchaeota archaeon]
MFELFTSMIKEEWRIHSTVFGNMAFMFLPVLAFLLSIGLSISLPLFVLLFSEFSVLIFIHYLFLFFGINIGAFGLFGKEWMNRRFGQASLLAYSSRSLPISERKVFFYMVLKDIVYYAFIWIIPILLGLFVSSFFVNIDFGPFQNYALSLSVSFFLGLSFVFFLSVLYAHLGRWFILVLGAVLVGVVKYFNLNFIDLFTVKFFLTYDFSYIRESLILIFVFFFLAILFASFDFPTHVSRFRNHLGKLEKLFSKFEFSEFIAKDLLDFKRTGAGLGRIFFSYLFPVGFIWFFLRFFVEKVIDANFLVLFAIFMGSFSASIYTWITEFDLFGQYSFLPIKPSDLIKSKIYSFSILNLVSFVILVVAGFVYSSFLMTLLSLLVFGIVSFFSLAITIYLTGLMPSVMFMNFKVLAKYLLVIIPSMLVLVFVNVLFDWLVLLVLLVLFLLSFVIFRKAFFKWDEIEQKTF